MGVQDQEQCDTGFACMGERNEFRVSPTEMGTLLICVMSITTGIFVSMKHGQINGTTTPIAVDNVLDLTSLRKEILFRSADRRVPDSGWRNLHTWLEEQKGFRKGPMRHDCEHRRCCIQSDMQKRR
jgi:hypothetical protein